LSETTDTHASAADWAPGGAVTSRLGAVWAAWHRQSVRKQILIGIGAVVLGLVALGALVPSESDGEPSAATESPSGLVEAEDGGTVRPADDAQADTELAAWAGDVVIWAGQLGDAFSGLGSLLQDNDFNTQLLLGDQDAVLEIAVPLAVMQNCTDSFPAPPADNAQATKVAGLVHRACAEFESSATQFAQGVDDVNVDLITSAASAMSRGNEILSEATAETAKLRG